jgi:hypothetical protein
MNALPPSDFDAGYRILEPHEPGRPRPPRGFASNRQAALNAQRRGFTVFPLHGGITPAIPNWRGAATTNVGVAHKLWTENLDYTVGAVLDGVVALCAEGRAGAEQLAALQNKYGPLPKTAAALSSGELYIFLRLPDGVRVKADTLAPAVEVLSGGFIGLPSASNEDTDRWVNRRPIELPPRGWLDLIAEPSASQTQTEGNDDMGAGAEAIKKFREGRLPDVPALVTDQQVPDTADSDHDDKKDEKDTSEIVQQKPAQTGGLFDDLIPSAAAPSPQSATAEQRYYSAKHKAAREHAANGWSVFPCKPNSKEPAIAGWPHAATMNPERIDGWWRENPNYNIGGATEGKLVADLDNKNGGSVEKSSDTLKARGPLPDTQASLTPSGGVHLIYDLPPHVSVRNSASKIAPGVDIRGSGGHILLPGSTIDGRSYQWIEGCSPKDRKQRAIAPQWFIDAAKARLEKSSAAGKQLGDEIDPDWAVTAAEKYIRELPETPEGSRNNTAYGVAAKLFDWPLSKAKVNELMTEWNETKCSLDSDELAGRVDSAAVSRQNARGVIGTSNGLNPVEVDESKHPAKAKSKSDEGKKDGNETDEPLATPYAPKDPTTIPPREWLMLGMLCRRNLSILAGPPGVAKTQLLLTVALALVTGRGDILGLPVKKRCRVWFWNQEDPLDELERRIAALRIAFDISDEDLLDENGKQMLFLNSGVDDPLLLAEANGDRAVKRGAKVDAIINEIRANKIDVLMLDPTVEFHEAPESDNAQMRKVMGFAREIIVATGCAGHLGAHTRKPDKASSKGFAGDMDAIRGASAQAGVARIAHTLMLASADDAKRWRLDGSHLDYVRLDMAKNNLGRRWSEPRVFKFDEIPIGMEAEPIGVLRPVQLSAREDNRLDILAAAMKEAGRTEARANEVIGMLPDDHKRLFGKNKTHWAREVQKAFVGPAEATTEHGILSWSCAGEKSPTVLRLQSAPSAPGTENDLAQMQN